MDIERTKLRGLSPLEEPRTPEELRVRQMKARDMLRGDLEGADLDEYVESRVLTTTLERAQNWARGNSLFPATFGLACCAIEMMSVVGARLDIARFGFEAFRASPRQADLLILSGRVSIKMAPVVRRIYDQMLEPKYVIAMLFLLFDIEVLFLYPIAVQLRAFGTFALVETTVFIGLLLVAFVYVWRRGALTWK